MVPFQNLLQNPESKFHISAKTIRNPQSQITKVIVEVLSPAPW